MNTVTLILDPEIVELGLAMTQPGHFVIWLQLPIALPLAHEMIHVCQEIVYPEMGEEQREKEAHELMGIFLNEHQEEMETILLELLLADGCQLDVPVQKDWITTYLLNQDVSWIK